MNLNNINRNNGNEFGCGLFRNGNNGEKDEIENKDIKIKQFCIYLQETFSSLKKLDDEKIKFLVNILIDAGIESYESFYELSSFLCKDDFDSINGTGSETDDGLWNTSKIYDVLKNGYNNKNQQLFFDKIKKCKRKVEIPDESSSHLEQYILVDKDDYKFESTEFQIRETNIKIEGVEPSLQSDVENKTVLVIGETGSGKTTFINCMINYIFGIQYDSDIRVRIANNVENVYSNDTSGNIHDNTHDDINQASSQTNFIDIYKLDHHEEYEIDSNLTIIDTPGFGDTRGYEKDIEMMDSFKELLQNRIKTIDLICFVVNASYARLDDKQIYIFESVLRLFGRDCRENIALITTFADHKEPAVLSAINTFRIPYSDYFKMNNSALFSSNSNDDDFTRQYWNISESKIKDIFTFLKGTKNLNLKMTKKVLSKRYNIEKDLDELLFTEDVLKLKSDRLYKYLQIEARLDRQIATNKSFVTIVKEIRSNLEDKSGLGIHTTTCLNCNYTCHENCTCIVKELSRKNCSVMSNHGYCTKCPGKCHYQYHENTPFILRNYEETKHIVSEEKEKRYHHDVEKKKLLKKKFLKLTLELKSDALYFQKIMKALRKSFFQLDKIALITEKSSKRSFTSQNYFKKILHLEKKRKDRKDCLIQLCENTIQKIDFVDKIVNRNARNWNNIVELPITKLEMEILFWKEYNSRILVRLLHFGASTYVSYFWLSKIAIPYVPSPVYCSFLTFTSYLCLSKIIFPEASEILVESSRALKSKSYKDFVSPVVAPFLMTFQKRLYFGISTCKLYLQRKPAWQGFSNIVKEELSPVIKWFSMVGEELSLSPIIKCLYFQRKPAWQGFSNLVREELSPRIKWLYLQRKPAWQGFSNLVKEELSPVIKWFSMVEEKLSPIIKITLRCKSYFSNSIWPVVLPFAINTSNWLYSYIATYESYLLKFIWPAFAPYVINITYGLPYAASAYIARLYLSRLILPVFSTPYVINIINQLYSSTLTGKLYLSKLVWPAVFVSI